MTNGVWLYFLKQKRALVVSQERILNRNTAMIFTPGQQVVWHYVRQWPRRQPILVDAEVAQYGRLRTRIRIHTASNTVLFRWVHPKNLRPKSTDEPAYPYPALPKRDG